MTSVTLTTTAAEGLPRRRFTVADLEAMVQAGILDENERVELIGGELVPMSPKGDSHEDVKVPLVDHWIRQRTDVTAVVQETAFRRRTARLPPSRFPKRLLAAMHCPSRCRGPGAADKARHRCRLPPICR